MADHGGPAFPRSGSFDPDYAHADQGDVGMSLRDWFAGQAASGLASRTDASAGPHDLAEYAYTIADALLKARGQVMSDWKPIASAPKDGTA